jgi:hypothetical protein
MQLLAIILARRAGECYILAWRFRKFFSKHPLITIKIVQKRV